MNDSRGLPRNGRNEKFRLEHVKPQMLVGMIRGSKFTSAAAICLGIIAFALLLASMSRVPYVDDDETLWASAAYELMRNGRAVPSVLADYPEANRFDLFYGPLGFRLGAFAFRVFGFTTASFRALSLLGAALLAVASAWLVRLIGGTRVVAFVCFALVALSPEVGYRATGGRMDTLAVGCLVVGLALLTRGSYAVRRWRSCVWWAAAGVVWSLAVLTTTPRVLPFFLALGVSAAGASCVSAKFRRRVFPGVAVSGVFVIVIVSTWLASEGLMLPSWLRYLAAVSAGDKFNTSPLLGGAWRLSPSPHTTLTPLILCLTLVGLFFVRAGRDEHCRDCHRLQFVFGVVLLNALFTLALIARPFFYGIFWALPVLPVALALTWRRIAHPNRSPAATIAVAGLWACLALAYVGIRVAKHIEAAQTWEARDPARVEQFMRENIPLGSKVYGPQLYFFYAVERAGSSYRYTRKATTSGLAAPVSGFETYSPSPPLPSRHPAQYLLWHTDQPPPSRFVVTRLVARFEPERESKQWLSRFGSQGGFPSFNLYEVIQDDGDKR